jgi:DNA-binding transcriptional ArsR family regulator
MAPSDTTSTEPTETSQFPEMRTVTDPKTMRALTHPVRLALLEALALEGPLTATQAGALIGESPTTCSFHFRQLEKYGFVEEAGVGPGRQRHWKRVDIWVNIGDTNDDPEANIAAKGLERLLYERAIVRIRDFYETKSNLPKVWQEASDSTHALIYVTPSELREINTQLLTILQSFHPRLENLSLRPDGALPVELLVFAYPAPSPSPSVSS